jgi:hypothetical protein
LYECVVLLYHGKLVLTIESFLTCADRIVRWKM